MVVRPLRPDDVDAAVRHQYAVFADLDRRLGEPVEPLTDRVRERARGRIDHCRRTCPDGAWVAEADGRVVGLALALRRGPLWFLSLLSVEPGLQGQGTGRRLLEAALRTAEGAAGAFLEATPDPRALRRYAAAGFDLAPGYALRGPVDRALLPAGLGVREGDLAADRDLVEDVVTGLRGAAYGPDLDAMAAAGDRLVVAEDGRDRGFAVLRPDRVVCLGATAPALAQRLLWEALARHDGDAHLDPVVASQQWAVQVGVAARLAVRPGGSLCTRGQLGPLAPYLPGGAYG